MPTLNFNSERSLIVPQSVAAQAAVPQAVASTPVVPQPVAQQRVAQPPIAPQPPHHRSAVVLGRAVPLFICVLFLHACSGTAAPFASADAGGNGGNGGSSARDAGGPSNRDAGTSLPAAGTGGESGAGDGGSGGSGGSAETPDAGTPDASGNADAGTAFAIRSPAFTNDPSCAPGDRAACDLFPVENTGLGGSADVSPEIDWTPGPSGTQSYAVALHDLTFLNGGDPYTHWTMWNIPASATGLPAELPAGRKPGVPVDTTEQVSIRSDGGFTGSGACGNVYEFVLYALDTDSFVPDDTGSPDDVEAALESSSSVLATATMRARSNPNGPCTPN